MYKIVKVKDGLFEIERKSDSVRHHIGYAKMKYAIDAANKLLAGRIRFTPLDTQVFADAYNQKHPSKAAI